MGVAFIIVQGDDPVVELTVDVDLDTASEVEYRIDSTQGEITKKLTDTEMTVVDFVASIPLSAAETKGLDLGVLTHSLRVTISGKRTTVTLTHDKVKVVKSEFTD